MWFSKVTRLGALCDTTTSFDDEPCGRQKEGLCPRVVESDRDVTCSEHFGGTGKKRFTEKKKISKIVKPSFWWSQGSSSKLVVVSHKAPSLITYENRISSLAQLRVS